MQLSHWPRADLPATPDRSSPDRRVACVTCGLTLATLSTIVFLYVVAAVVHGGVLVQWDHSVNDWMRAHGTPSGDRLWTDVSLLGLPGVWIVDVAVGIVILWRR